MKNIKLNKYPLPLNAGRYLWLLVFLCLFINNAQSQDATNTSGSTTEALKPIKNTFDDILVIDDQTVMVPQKNTFEFELEHRFGAPISDGYKDMCGLFAGANMAIKFNYSLVTNLNLGIGLNEENKTWEGNLKYALMRQSEKGGWPVSISYYGNFAIDGRPSAGNFVNNNDRFSYFDEIMIARKFTDKLSIQTAASLSYFNNIAGYLNADGNIQQSMYNYQYAMEFIGRYKITETFAIIVDYDQPLTTQIMNNPHPNVAYGIDLGTKGHSFQLFLTNYGYTLPQNDNFYNQNDFTKGHWLIGFNITRKWHF